MSRKRKLILAILAALVIIYLGNSSLLAPSLPGKPLLLAHRGLAQTFSMSGITNETNTARRIYPPEHPYLENTIPSMAAAFQLGANIVELDIQLTKDGQFAVFHDADLSYRTDGTGSIRDHTMAELKKLDVGYGYTADNGKTFPFRGKGIGLMPTLDEVLSRFPQSHFLIHMKSNEPLDGEELARYLSSLPAVRLQQLAVYGGNKPIAALHGRLPNLRVMSADTSVKGLLSYMAIGWTGYLPPNCRNTEFHIPIKYARWLWGWPNRFLARMDAVNTRVIVVKGDGRFSEGFDTRKDLELLPPRYTGGIWTNRIDRIAPAYKNPKYLAL